MISGKKAELNVYLFEKDIELTNEKGIVVMPSLSNQFVVLCYNETLICNPNLKPLQLIVTLSPL